MSRWSIAVSVPLATLAGMGIINAEDEARGLIERAGFSSDATPTPFTLATRLLGEHGLVFASGMAQGARYVPEERRIRVRPRLGAVRARFLVAHELGEMRLDELGYTGDDREQLADAIAAGLLCPRAPFRAAVREHGRELPVLAREFMTSESIALLRYGEATGTPVVLVTPQHVHVRGDDFGWPSARELRRIAVAEEVPPEIERREISDARRRVGLLAA
jgi:hypothetical protein